MEIKQLLNHLALATYVPCTLFQNGELVYHSPDLIILPRLTGLIYDRAIPLHKDVVCEFTEESLCIGFIKLKQQDGLVIVGPVSSIACNNQRAQIILHHFGLPSSLAGDLLGYFSNTPKLALSHFANQLILLNYILNQETLTILDLLPDDYRFDRTNSDLPAERSAFSDDEQLHNSHDFEKKLFALIKYGKPQELDNLFNVSAFSGNVGILASDSLRNAKNLIICSVTLASRAAVDGGLDYEVAMRRADAYLQKVEIAPDIPSVYALNQNMMKTYASLVAKRKIGNPDSPTAVKIYNYVEQHIYGKIREQDIANALGISRPYLCTQFKRETGINLNDFIIRAKIDEAKSQLTTTNKSISEIALLLDFSSQSYFQAVFKKVTAMTPKQFRLNNFNN